MSGDGTPVEPAASSSPPAESVAAAARTPRAGRDLPMAIGVGVGLGAVIIASLLLYRPGFVVIIAAAVVAAVWEMKTTLASSRDMRITWIAVGRRPVWPSWR